MFLLVGCNKQGATATPNRSEQQAQMRGDSANPTGQYRKNADRGIAQDQYNLGVCYYNGQYVHQDVAEAVKWFRKAGEQGYPPAETMLGQCFERGIGIPEDYTEAARWYRKAADQGEAFAQAKLGHCYMQGNGVGKDNEEAAKWFRQAAEQGNSMTHHPQFHLFAGGGGFIPHAPSPRGPVPILASGRTLALRARPSAQLRRSSICLSMVLASGTVCAKPVRMFSVVSSCLA